MLSVAKLAPGQEGYYERSVARGLDDYYAGKGESPGLWAGAGARLLGLEGVVADGQLGQLIGGYDPASGARLRRHPRQRLITIERIDPAAGTRMLEQKTLAPVAGFDLVFSVPKSVSLLHALGDEHARRAVNEAHTTAWQAALAYLEDEACVTRRGRSGVVRERAGGFVAAAYQHRTSRAQDPHLHTHVIVANMARSPDGSWRALDGKAILETYRLAAGYLYEAQLRHELSSRLGVEWGPVTKGMAELARVPRTVIDEFSQRRRQILDDLAASARTGFHAARTAAVATRDRKHEVDLADLREQWRVRAAEHGLNAKALARLCGRPASRTPSPAELRAAADRMLSPDGLTAKQTTVTSPELVMAWAQSHQQGAPADRIREISERFTRLGGVEQVTEADGPGRPARYSTRELVEHERRALAIAARGRDAGAPTAPPASIEGLSAEQRRMVEHVLASRHRVVCVVGLAGAGKTTAASAIHAAYRAEDTPILGAAPSGIAAQQLEDATAIPTTTLHRLNAEASRVGLPARCVVLVDEAGMADTRTLAPLLDQVERARGKLILVGDPRQLPAVGAGGLYAALVDRHAAITLTENRRQHSALERHALDRLRSGHGRDYLAHAERERHLITQPTPTATRARLLADWWCHARDNLEGTLIIAHRRQDVRQLNSLARAILDSHGRLGNDRLTAAGIELAVGDRVICRANHDEHGVRNGTRATITSVDPAARTVTLATDRGTTVTLTAAYLDAGHLDHGYAITGHAAQGITIDTALVLADGDHQRLQEWGYVALSRARHQTRLYLTETGPEPLDTRFRPDGRPDPRSSLAAALERSASEPLATQQAPLPGPAASTSAAIDPAPAPNRLAQQEEIARRLLGGSFAASL